MLSASPFGLLSLLFNVFLSFFSFVHSILLCVREKEANIYIYSELISSEFLMAMMIKTTQHSSVPQFEKEKINLEQFTISDPSMNQRTLNRLTKKSLPIILQLFRISCKKTETSSIKFGRSLHRDTFKKRKILLMRVYNRKERERESRDKSKLSLRVYTLFTRSRRSK